VSVISSIAPARTARRAAAERAPRCLSTDMLLVHKVFRREFGMLPALIAGVSAGNTDRAGMVAAHCRELATALRHHHGAEQELLWPRIRDRATLDPAVESTLKRHHQNHMALLRELDGLLALWEADADTELRDALVDISTELAEWLTAHLDTSERHVLTAVDENFTTAEWLALGLRAASWIPLHRMAWMLGAMLEDATPAERENLLAKVPGPARLLFRMVGQEQYLREMRALRVPSH
jgi:hypothetical protein